MDGSQNFIEEIIEQDLVNKVHREGIATRFPPEPNGYLHIGHAKSICLNFGLALKYKGKVNLRFDDTNPEAEDSRYVDAIREDIRWLGFEWHDEFYASDYFETLYGFAVHLIKKRLAYVDDSTPEEIARQKGTPQIAGIANQYRDRPVDENLLLFKAMKDGQFADGDKVLRAKIDLTSDNMHMRDPIMYRIKHTPHHRTGTKWCIYPLYDFAHGQSDAIEHISHSTCTLEFVAHRPLYNWFIAELGLFPSKQIEFARLNLAYTVMSKRKLLQLIEHHVVDGWDDPRLPTIAGLRRRGYTPAAIRDFCERIGVSKRDNLTEAGLLEFCIREDLNRSAQRRIAVLRPLKIILTNYDEATVEYMTLENFPGQDSGSTRELPFTRELWIERDDFKENPEKNYFRLALGKMVRLKGAYVIVCDGMMKDDRGNITELHGRYFPETRSGSDRSDFKVKGTIHWLSVARAVPAEIRLYERLFTIENPQEQGNNFTDHVNKNSKLVLQNAYVEPDLAERTQPNVPFQFIRLGYFIKDRDSTSGRLVFNRTVNLKDGGKKG